MTFSINTHCADSGAIGLVGSDVLRCENTPCGSYLRHVDNAPMPCARFSVLPHAAVLNSVGNAISQCVEWVSNTTTAVEEGWRLQGATLRRQSEECMEVRSHGMGFTPRLKPKGAIAYALIGMALMRTSMDPLPGKLHRSDYRASPPLNRHGVLEATSWPTPAGSRWDFFKHTASGMRGFFHAVTDSLCAAMSRLDRQLRFPTASATSTLLLNRKENGDDVFHADIRHTGSIHFPAESDHDVLPLRNEIIGRFLATKGHLDVDIASADEFSSVDIVIAAIDFIQTKKYGERLLAMRLRRHAGLYGGWENEPTSILSDQAVNRKWFSENIFGGSLDQFIIEKINHSKMRWHWNTKLLYKIVLGIFNGFFIRDDIDIKTARAIGWAWDNLVLRQLPMLQYTQSPHIMMMPLTHFSWGQMHAGLLWAQHISLNISTIAEEEASALGNFLIAGIKHDALSSSWMRLFSLPATIRFLDHDSDNEDILSAYFNDRETYLKNIYPVNELALLMNNYKKRSEFDYDTTAFAEQNKEIAACYAKIDKIRVSAALSDLPKDEYDFLFLAEMKKIDATFSWIRPWYYFGMTPEEAAIVSRMSKISLPMTVDLILADNGIEERFYALWQHNGKVQCKRMQSDEDYYAIFDDKRPQSDSGYRIEIERYGRDLKKRFETLHIAINTLVKIHEKKINKQLCDYGHDKSTGEIVRDVLLSFIPFYTCIHESYQGNIELAVQACMMDVMSLIIPSTQLAVMAVRMSELLGVEAMLAINYFLTRHAMQVSMKSAAMEGMTHFLHYGAYAAVQTLSWQHLAMLARVVDPGFEISYLIGRMGVRQALRLGKRIVNIAPGLEKTLSKVTDEMLMTLSEAFHFNGANQVGHIGKHPVKHIGFDALSSNDVYAAFSFITGEAYGYKYYRLADGTFRMVPHNTKHNFLNLNMLQQGLGGNGSPIQGQAWAAEVRGSANVQDVTQAAPPSASETFRPVDAPLLIDLTQMSFDEFILQGGLAGVARDNKLDLSVLMLYLDEARRLTPLGKRMLDMAQAGPSGLNTRRGVLRRTQDGFRHRYLLSLWFQLAEEERTRMGGIEGFAAQHAVEPARLQRYLRKNGSLNLAGNALMVNGEFDQLAAGARNVMPRRIMRKRVEYRGELHRELLMKWIAMTPEERYRDGGLQGFAAKHNADPEQLRSYLKKDEELNCNGKLLIRRARSDAECHSVGKEATHPLVSRRRYNGGVHRHILMLWHHMSPQERNEAGGLVAFATQHGADPQRMGSYFTLDDELNYAGLRFINSYAKNARRVKADEVEKSENSADAHLSGVRAGATKGPLEPKPSVEDVNDERVTIGTAFTVKDEPLEAESAVPHHQIDDDLPVLQSPDDNRVSVLAQSEVSIDNLRVTHWSDLHDVFSTLPRARISEVKRKILADAQMWLRHQGEHSARFQQMVYAAYDLAEGPERGISIFARRPIAQFEVIGPYSGVLHASVESLQAEMAQVGAVNVNTYLWGTRSAQRALSAFGHGNTLSLVNTGHLPGYPQWRMNNLSAIRVGNNLIFYVAMRDIGMNEELLVNYGNSFNPTETG